MKNEQKTFSLSHYFSQLKRRVKEKNMKPVEINSYHCHRCGELIEGLDTTMKHYCVGEKLNVKGEKEMMGEDFEREVEMNDEQVNERKGEARMEDLNQEIKNLIESRNLGGGRFGLNDEKTNTNLISKNYSPLIVRKYNVISGWPLYVGIICDENLDDLDFVVNAVIKECREAGMITNSIQQMRNVTGILSETIINHYNKAKENCVEGVAILLYIDKCAIENFFGDFMSHTSCRIEWSGIINLLPHV